MSEKTGNQPPNEIPTRKNPDKTDPVKDPDLSPDSSNPINPQDDESTGRKIYIPNPEPHSPGYDENEGRNNK